MTKRQKLHRACIAEAQKLGIKLENVTYLSDGIVALMQNDLDCKKQEIAAAKKANKSKQSNQKLEDTQEKEEEAAEDD